MPTYPPRPAQLPVGTHLLWPTPIGIYRYERAATVNALLVPVLAALRAEQERRRGVPPGAAFFASDDDLHRRLDVEGWHHLLQFIVDGIAQTVEHANIDAWAGRVTRVRVALEGMWFQATAGGAGHDVHTHGNCSWSGVYIVQADEVPAGAPAADAQPGIGVTRLYGPHFTTLGGAYVDIGNAYLQMPHLDVDPVEGQLLVFPAWLLHQAMPYAGRRERVVISFNASIHSSDGDQLFDYSAR